MRQNLLAKAFASIFVLVITFSFIPVAVSADQMSLSFSSATVEEGIDYVAHVEVEDGSGVGWIELRENNNLIQTDSALGAVDFDRDYTIKGKSVPGVSYTYELKAYDKYSAPIFSSTNTFKVGILESIDIENVKTLPGNKLTGTASDNFGIQTVQLLQGGKAIETEDSCLGKTSCNFEFNVAYGTTYAIQAQDKDGHLKMIFVTPQAPITNIPPQAYLHADITRGTAPFEATFDLTGTNDPDGNVIHFELDFGDGESEGRDVVGDSAFNGMEIEHTYANFGIYTAELTVTDNNFADASTTLTIIADYSGTHIHNGSGGGVGADTHYSGGSSSSGTTALIFSGELIISESHLNLKAGEALELPITIDNTGSAGDFKIEIVKADFGIVKVEDNSNFLSDGEKASTLLDIKTNEDASGSYVLKINLLRNGEVVDTGRIYVTVKGIEPTNWIVIVTLLIVSAAGLGGLGYFIYTERKKK